jgi:hypothetical protein
MISEKIQIGSISQPDAATTACAQQVPVLVWPSPSRTSDPDPVQQLPALWQT